MADKQTRFPYDDELADPYEGDDVKNPHEEAGAAGEPAADQPEAPRRRPGRPRKGT